MNTELATLIEKTLYDLLPKEKSLLLDAIFYSVFSGGKRIRGSILIKIADIFNIQRETSIYIAVVIELLHEYTLIHDDIIDQDDERRGKPSCYNKYGEPIAILAGNAILAYAIELVLKSDLIHEHNVKNEILLIICQSVGYSGLMNGQSLDVEGKSSSIEVALFKTSPLFIASADIIGVLGNLDKTSKMNLHEFGKNFGIAYQLSDDIKDSMTKKEKINIINEVDLNEAIRLRDTFLDAAKEHLRNIGGDIDKLTNFISTLSI